MDKMDPNQWTPSFVSSNRSFCMRTLQDSCGTIIDLVRNREYEVAVVGLDRLLNGMITMQNHAGCNYKSQICFCSWVEAEIVAFGVTRAPEEKRREVALGLYEDARDFAQHQKTIAALSAVIRDLRSGKSMAAIQQIHDPNFPDSVLSILESVRGKIGSPTCSTSQGKTVAAAASSPESKRVSQTEEPRRSGLPFVVIGLILVCFLCLWLFFPNWISRPKEAASDTPAPVQTTAPATTEDTGVTGTTDVPTEAPAGVAYVVKTESGNGLNLREGPSTDAEIITAMDEWSIVTVLETQDNWAFVSFGDLTGWCSMDYLVPEGSISASEETSVTAVVTTSGDALRLRTEPSLDCDVIDGIPNGTEVIVLRQEGQWSYVEYNGTRGWCASEYLIIP